MWGWAKSLMGLRSLRFCRAGNQVSRKEHGLGDRQTWVWLWTRVLAAE